MTPDGDRKSISINARAVPELEAAVLASGDANFDNISGATVTSDGYRESLQAIIRGMTPAERADPKIINASRRMRIANGSGVAVSEVNQLVDRFFEARKMMAQMAGSFGFPGARKSSKNRKNAKGKKGKGGKGPTPAKVRNPLGAAMPPGGFPDLSQMPPGLDELPPGLANFDLSKLKFPGQK